MRRHSGETKPSERDPGPLRFQYRFRFADGTERAITVQLDRKTLDAQLPPRAAPPDWTALSHHKCAHCPLPDAAGARCPAALSLVDVADLFSGALSFQQVDVTIESEARTYAKRTTLQRAVSSLIGLLMVTSGCPVMGKLRPMAQFHLPFASTQETKYRVLSMYLLAQFFRSKQGRLPDWDLKGLTRLYQDIRVLNRHVAKRLGDVGSGDAHLNALVILDTFADSISFSIDRRRLGELERLFRSYFDERPA